MDAIGRLNRRVTLVQNGLPVANEAGERIYPQPRETGLFAAVEMRPVGSDEKDDGGKLTSRITVNFTIRNNPGLLLDTTDRIRYGGREYLINAVLEADPLRRYLTLETTHYT